MRWLAVCALLWVSASSAAISADFDIAASWWTNLTEDQRFEIQTRLILTGDYDAMIDGTFGPATFRALKAFQADSGVPSPDGMLNQSETETLRERSDRIFDELGMEVVQDESSGVAAFAPRKFLTEIEPSAEGGLSLSSRDGGLKFFLQGWEDTGLSLEQARSEMIRATNGAVITYNVAKDDLVVVTGRSGDISFYTMLNRDGVKVVGFNVFWTPQYADIGLLTAVFAASMSGRSELFNIVDPLDEPLPVERPATSPVETPKHAAKTPESDGLPGTTIGPFFLPDDDPTIIALIGPIDGGTALDFLRALRSRPSARTIVLASDGGSVNEGLLVAHQVAERGLSTFVPEGLGCYSACAFVFFAGKSRIAVGELGVHQISGDGVDSSSTQVVLSDVLDALEAFGVPQQVISVMLRTRPNEMHVFTGAEIAALEINRANPQEINEQLQDKGF